MTKLKLNERSQTAHEFAHEDREATLERQPIRHRAEWEIYNAVRVIDPESFNQRLAQEAIKNYDNAQARAGQFERQPNGETNA